MVLEQNVQWSVVWDSEKKDYLGIITVRDLLEMIVYLVDSLKESFQLSECADLQETPYLGFFLERYLMIPLSPEHQSKGRKASKASDVSEGTFKPNLSLLEKVLDQVTLLEWFTVSKDIVKFHKSKLTNECSIDDSLYTCLQYMNDHGLNVLAIINQERSMIQGQINYSEIMKFMVENYTGSDLTVFEEPLSSFDLTHHNLFPSYQKLLIARDTDSLFSVLKKMRDNRVSCIPIEHQISKSDTQTTRTVGLAFMTDLMFLFRLPEYYKRLDEPVITLVTDLNGLEED